jgi:hypothetical protein
VNEMGKWKVKNGQDRWKGRGTVQESEGYVERKSEGKEEGRVMKRKRKG